MNLQLNFTVMKAVLFWPDDRAKCIEHGCDDYIRKPIQTDAFVNIVFKYLQ